MPDTGDTCILTARVDRSPVQLVMKHHPPEFRAEAVALYRSRPAATIKSVADDLGINFEKLRNSIRLDDAQRAARAGPLTGGGTRHRAQGGPLFRGEALCCRK